MKRWILRRTLLTSIGLSREPVTFASARFALQADVVYDLGADQWSGYPAMMRLACVLVVVAACGNKRKDPGETPEAKVGTPPAAAIDAAMAAEVDAAAAAKPDPCSHDALKLAAGAVPLEPWKSPPAGCSPKGEEPRLIRSAADFDKHVTCTGAKPTIDYAKQAIVMSPVTRSPRALGVTIYDDGKTITIVHKYEPPPGPGEPHIAGGATREVYWHVVPAGADRAFATAGCEI